MKYLLLLLFMMPGCPFLGIDAELDDDPSPQETVLRVKEAEHMILLYEARLKTARSQLKQDEIARDYAQEVLARLDKLHTEKVVTEKDYLAALKEHRLAILEVEESIGEVQEAEQDLELAKVRKQIAALGEKASAVKIDRIRVRHNRSK